VADKPLKMSGEADLAGILVVAVEQAVAAPFCTSRLADAGARVIKIERPEGDFARGYDADVMGQSAYFVWLNRGKESLCLDIKNPADGALLDALLAKADVFVQNLAPGAAARAGFESAALRAKFPRLITCDISGYGEDGPYAAMKAYDLLVQAESGLAFLTGTPESAARVGVSVCDIGAGMSAHAAILRALFARERSGAGCGLQVSLFDAMADWMNVPYLQYRYGGRAPQRAGLNHPTIAPYGAYVCAGGDALLISIQNEREWQAFCTSILGRPELAHDERFASNPLRVRNRAGLDEIIAAAFGRVRIEALADLLRLAGVAFGRINDVPGLARHPQLRLQRVETPEGTIDVIAAPARIKTAGATGERAEPPASRVPAVGEQSEAIRREFLGEPIRVPTSPQPDAAKKAG
jgi:crotonobetainyl-CoA:carnitine CoA-transferase CaiB-like acyl-CoA transferase